MGLNDRDYMRSSAGYDDASGGMGAVWGLIAANAVMFLLLAPPGSKLYRELAMCCWSGNFRFYQLLTAGFLHHGWSHILFNMYGLYIFGKLAAPRLGGRNFLFLYLAGVLCGNGLFLALNHDSGTFLVGASGAVCAVMMAAAMLEPDRRFVMLLLPLNPIKTTTLVVCYTILEVVFEFTGIDSGIAHLAHLGGFVGGYLLVKAVLRGNTAWDPFRRKRTIHWRNAGSGGRQRQETVFSASPVSRDELDALLDKISRTGINSLSPEELARLKRAREEMRR